MDVKCGLFRILPLGVLNETARISSLSMYLVSSGRQVPPGECYFGRFCHTRWATSTGRGMYNVYVAALDQLIADRVRWTPYTVVDI
jgi:hypothetical protein